MVAARYNKDYLLNCWTSSSDISGYHADFHEGHDTIGAWQGHGMVCVNRPLRDLLCGFLVRFQSVVPEVQKCASLITDTGRTRRTHFVTSCTRGAHWATNDLQKLCVPVYKISVPTVAQHYLIIS